MPNGNNVSWFFESAADRATSNYVEYKSSFGALQDSEQKSFDDRFNELCESYKTDYKLDIKRDMRQMLSDRALMEQYKTDLLEPVMEAFKEAHPNDPHIVSICENASSFWDTKVKSYTESASIVNFLPISTLEFPVLVKQFFSSILKDIIEIETVKTPAITKHVRTTYMVDNNTGEEYEYPKCLFNGDWQKLWEASKGKKINEEVVPLTSGRLYKYDIITNLADGTPGIDKLSFALKIIAVKIGSEVARIPGNGITIEFSTNGTFINGDLDFVTPGGVQVADTLGGQVDFKNGLVSISSASGQVEGVVFEGYLSNENNLRSISVREKRDILRFTIEDGPRWNMPFTIEEIEDAAALLDINYYNRMVDEIVKTQEMNETMSVIKFLNDEFKKFNGVKTDIYKLESLAQVFDVDLKPPVNFSGDPFKYRSSVIQFRLKAIVHQLTEMTKLDGLSFIIVGNPMATQLMSEFTQWKSQQGTSIGGIDLNNSYGFATDMGANIRVVATNIYDAYTKDVIEATQSRELVLHIYGYPTNAEHISYRHLKYTSHLLTSQSQTAYQSTQAPAGAYNIVTATSRYKDIAIQGIQAQLILLHSEDIYGKVPALTPTSMITGAPWPNDEKWPADPLNP